MLALARRAGVDSPDRSAVPPRSSRRPGPRRRRSTRPAPAGPARRRGPGPARGRARATRRSIWSCAGTTASARRTSSARRSGWPSAAGRCSATSTTCRPRPTGWDRATASHNTVVVDGLNQRETPGRGRRARPRRRFPLLRRRSRLPGRHARRSPAPIRSRRPAIARRSSRPRARGPAYAVASSRSTAGSSTTRSSTPPPGTPARWQLSVPMAARPGDAPPAIDHLTSPRPAPRMAAGSSRPTESSPSLAQGRVTRPGDGLAGRHRRARRRAAAPARRRPGARSSRPSAPTRSPRPPSRRGRRAGTRRFDPPPPFGRRRRPRRSTFVTVFEPIGAGAPLATRRARGVVAPRRWSSISRRPRVASTSWSTSRRGPPARSSSPTAGTWRPTAWPCASSDRGLVLAGGTFAEMSDGRQVRQEPATGIIRGVVRQLSGPSRGWFESDASIPDASALAGRVLLVRHGDGTVRGWTLHEVQNIDRGVRLFVREEPGFELEPGRDGEARYYQFPRTSMPGLHRFRIARIARSSEPGK